MVRSNRHSCCDSCMVSFRLSCLPEIHGGTVYGGGSLGSPQFHAHRSDTVWPSMYKPLPSSRSVDTRSVWYETRSSHSLAVLGHPLAGGAASSTSKRRRPIDSSARCRWKRFGCPSDQRRLWRGALLQVRPCIPLFYYPFSVSVTLHAHPLNPSYPIDQHAMYTSIARNQQQLLSFHSRLT